MNTHIWRNVKSLMELQQSRSGDSLIQIFSKKDHSLQAEASIICFIIDVIQSTAKLYWPCPHRFEFPHYRTLAVGKKCQTILTISLAVLLSHSSLSLHLSSKCRGQWQFPITERRPLPMA